MTPPAGDGPRMTLPQSDFEALLERAAEKGARRALADVGLDCEHAAGDVHDLRSLFAVLRLVRTTATSVRAPPLSQHHAARRAQADPP